MSLESHVSLLAFAGAEVPPGKIVYLVVDRKTIL